MTAEGRSRLRHARAGAGPWPNPFMGTLLDVRPLDPVRSIKGKLIVVIGATLTTYMLITWMGDRLFGLGVLRTFPVALVAALALTQVLGRGMTRPLREMTAATAAMARGDYAIRVHTDSRDEVGQLAAAFNSMAQDLEGLDTQRREMIANVSHELRTPVAALRAQVENMADGVIAPDGESLEAMLRQIERLSRLLAYLLDLSRLEAGAAALHLAPLDVRTFLSDLTRTAADAHRVSGDKQLTWHVDADPDDLELVADAERLRQVLTNLLENAARHSPERGAVTVRAELEPDGAHVALDVIDEGDGIPLADRDRVFARFERGNAPRQTGTASTGGTGLGLAIARWAVGLHGGTIAAVDPPGDVGTRIRVRLPATGPASGGDARDGAARVGVSGAATAGRDPHV